jgi:hypothetical protein
MSLKSVTIIVCDKETDAINRKAFLEAPPNKMAVTIEEVTDFVSWDAHQFSDGKKDDPSAKWVVIGRK